MGNVRENFLQSNVLGFDGNFSCFTHRQDLARTTGTLKAAWS